MSSDSESLWTTDDVAEWLGVQPGTLRNWRSQGKGPKYVKVGGSVRYRPEDVRSWAADRVTSPEDEEQS